MNVADVMTTDVVSVEPQTPFKEAVELMVANDVSGLPVLDELGRVIGVVTEADLIPKTGYAGRRRRIATVLLDVIDGRAGAWEKSHARTVADVMSGKVVAVRPTDSVGHAARVLLAAKVKRAPVVDDVGALVGVISRQDLLGSFFRPDAAIADDVEAALADPTRVPETHGVRPHVRDGVVTLEGDVQFEVDRHVVKAVVWRIPGVVDVVDHLGARAPDPVLDRL